METVRIMISSICRGRITHNAGATSRARGRLFVVSSVLALSAFLFFRPGTFSIETYRSAEAADTWSDPHPGIRRLDRTATGPLRIHALVVDLCAPGISVRATAPSEKQQRPSTFAQSVGAQAVINGDFFNFTDYNVIGMAVGNGQDWGNSDSAWQAFTAFGRHRAYFSQDHETYNSPEPWMREVMSGFAQLVRNGEVITSYDCSGHFCQRHPRTAVGLSRDSRTLYMMVIDGRSSNSIGVNLTELAQQMHSIGAYNAVNLDGGGSTAMWVQGTGIVNSPSDGSERVVANHLAVHASGAGQPANCVHDPEEEARIYGPLWDGSASTDVNGDGIADVCARGYGGVFCRISTGNGFTEQWATGPEFGNELGWNDPSNYSTIRLADVTGDGSADVCGRGSNGLFCLPATAAGFDTTPVSGPAWSNAAGWNDVKYYSTIRFADVNGDGMADLCARGPDGIECYLSTGNGFGEAVYGPSHADSVGWDRPEHYSTYRVGDINGDGRDDLCARASASMWCYLSATGPFADRIDGPEWSNAAGWAQPKYYSTIRMADINGDGLADLCARGPDGIECYLSTGNGFGEKVQGPALTDASGWDDPTNYLTIRMGDINGNGMADICARANAGMRCWLSEGNGFSSTSIHGPAWSNEEGWFQAKYYHTIRLADVNGDGMADLCARGPDGVRCWLSDGTGFPEEIEGPSWADSVGWGSDMYYSTLRIQDPPPPVSHGEDGGVDPTADGGTTHDSTPGETDGGLIGDAGQGTEDGSPGDHPDNGSGDVAGGCSCYTTGKIGLPPVFFVILFFVLMFLKPGKRVNGKRS